MGRNTWTNVTTTVIGPALHEVGKKHERKPVLFNYILQTFVLKFYAPWDPPDQTQGRVSNMGVENRMGSALALLLQPSAELKQQQKVMASVQICFTTQEQSGTESRAAPSLFPQGNAAPLS